MGQGSSLHVQLDSGVYAGGQMVSGNVYLQAQEEIKYNSFVLRITGESIN